MNMKFPVLKGLVLIAFIFYLGNSGFSQAGNLKWSADGSSYIVTEQGSIVKYTLPQNTKTVLVAKNTLVPAGQGVRDGEQVLDILLAHPNCARFIATKLVRRFVSDALTEPHRRIDTNTYRR